MRQNYLLIITKMLLETKLISIKKVLLLPFIIILILGAQNSIGQTFNFETATGSGTNTITEAINGVTLTVTANGGLDNLNVYYLNPTFGNLIGPVGLFNTTTFTFSFSSAVNIESIFALERSGDISSTWTYTPAGGTNSTVNNFITDYGYQTVNLNWTNITSFTVTKPADATVFGFDRLIFTPASLDVEDYLNESLQLFPNPVNNLLHLKWSTNINVTDIILYDALGIAVKRSNTTILDFSNLPSGIYSTKIVTNKGTVIKKVVKK